MTNTHISMIRSLFSKGIEFIATTHNKVEALHDRRVLKFDELPKTAFETIKKEMNNPEATMCQMEVYAFHRWGGLDCQPDIAECGTAGDAEYMEDVAPAYYDNGKQISPAEMRVLRLMCYNDETIAEKLFISKYTVAGQVAAIYSNMNFEEGQNKRAATYEWTVKKGII